MRLGIIFGLIITLLPVTSFSQITRTWTQSTSSDFSSGTFDNTILTNANDGEIQLQAPLVITKSDSVNNTFGHSRSYNRRGQYIKYWIDHSSNNSALYIQRYDSLNQAESSAIRVDEQAYRVSDYASVGYMNSGFFYVAWRSFYFEVASQLFDSLGNKIGGNQFIAPSFFNPAVLANFKDNSFWIFVSKSFSDSARILFQRIDMNGNKIDSLQPIRSNNFYSTEYRINVAQNNTGDFILAFVGNNTPFTGGENLFVQRFTYQGLTIGSIKGVSNILNLGFDSPKIAFDDSGQYIVAWSDNRLRPFQSPGWTNIYAQLFDTNDIKIGNNFYVNTSDDNMTGRWRPNIYYFDSMYIASWEADSMGKGPFFYCNEWKYNFKLEGDFISSIHDAGPLLTSYDTLQFSSNIPPGTAIKFKLRSGNTIDELNNTTWTGPNGTPDSFYTNLKERISNINDRHRFIQYRAYLSVSNWGTTPILQDITIKYTLKDTTPPSPPLNITAWSGRLKISLSWQPSLSTGIKCYKIYRGTLSRSYNTSWLTSTSTQTSFFDSTAAPHKLYYYVITAIDTNLLESNYSAEVSANVLNLNLYVSGNAAPEGNGSYENPYQSIREAMKYTIAYDTVYVLPGTYPGMVHIKPHVALIGSGARITTIEAGNDSNVVRCDTGTTLRGFTIKLTGALSRWTAIWCGNASPTIEDNVIINTITIQNDYTAIFSNGGNIIIRRNYIVGFRGGISISEPNAYATILNNIVVSLFGGIEINNDARANITNNTIVIKGPGTGITLMSYPQVTMRNNIIIGNGTGGQGFGVNDNLGYHRLTILYNNTWNFTTIYDNVILGIGNITSDPLFVDLSSADFRLKNNSPCKNTGDPNSNFNNRDGSRNDMGAFGGPDPINPDIFPGFAVTLKIDNASGFPGDTVDIGVHLQDGARVASVHFLLEYNYNVLSLFSVEKTAQTSSMLFEVDSSRRGFLNISLSQATPLNISNCEIIRLRFNIAPGSAAGDASPLTITNLKLQDKDSFALILNELINGAVVVSSGGAGGRYIFVNYRNTTGIEDGSRSNPWKTIQLGIDHSTHGDTVMIAAGTYEEIISIPDSIHLKGSGATVTVLQADSANISLLSPAIKILNSYGSTISGLKIFAPYSALYPTIGPIDCQSSDIEIYNCVITTEGSAMTDLLRIRNNSFISFHDNNIIGSSGSSSPIGLTYNSNAHIFKNVINNGYIGITVSNSRATINNNRFLCFNAGLNAIEVMSQQPVFINNNLIYSGIFTQGGILALNSDSITVVNNTVVTNFTGIDSRNSNITLMNNIITGNQYNGIASSGTTTTSYNNVWGNGINFYNTTPGTGDISEDPKFSNSAAQDFRLLPDSPCKDAGNPDPIFNDLDGSRNDIGMSGGPDLDTTFFGNQGVTLSIAGSTIAKDDTIEIPISGSNLCGAASADISTSFNTSYLQFLDAKTTDYTSTFSLSRSEVTPGTLVIKLNNPYGLVSDSGTLCEIRFVSKPVSGTTTVRFQQAKLFTETKAEMPITKLQNAQITITSVRDREQLPTSFSLKQNYPNPFNPSTKIEYSIPKMNLVTIKIYDILGRKIATLVDERKQPGEYNVTWNAEGVPSGVYFYRIVAGEFVETKKMVVVK